MKYAILFLLLVLPVAAFGQSTPKAVDDVFTTNLLTAGTAMTSRTASTTSDDTTRAISLRGWSKVYLNVHTVAGDSINLRVAVQGSKNGVTWDGNFVVVDSIVNTSDGVTEFKSFEVPSSHMGLNSVRFRVYGAAWGGYSDSPTAAFKAECVRKHY